MESITQERLQRIVEIYKNGIQNWFRDEHFLMDCAYNEGAIKRASEHLGIEPPYKYINITDALQESFSSGYENFWK